MKRVVTILAMAFTVCWLLAGTAKAAEKWTDYNQISKIDVQDWATVYLQGNDGCKGLYRLSASTTNFREKLTLLMGAFFGGFEVNIKYNDSTHVPGSSCEYYILKVRTRQ